METAIHNSRFILLLIPCLILALAVIAGRAIAGKNNGVRPISPIKGFWNDLDGWSIGDVVTVLVLPVWMYVAIKFALAPDITNNQVDYFMVLSYPLLIAVGGKALGSLPLPWPRRSGMYPVQQPYYGYNGPDYIPYAPPSTGNLSQYQPAASGAINTPEPKAPPDSPEKPTI